MAVVHRVYAQALLEAAHEGGALPQVRKELAALAEALAGSSELRNLTRNPQIDAQAKREALAALTEGAHELLRNFLSLLVDKGRIAELPEIAEEFARLVAAQERVLKLELTTAVELSDEEAASLLRELEQAAGRRVEARRQVDPKLIGGLVLQAGSRRLDASVRGRLNRLRQELTTRR